MFGGNSNKDNSDSNSGETRVDRQKWHDKLDEIWDMTDKTFDRFASTVNDWGVRDLEESLGNSLPWIHSTFRLDSDDKDSLWAYPVPSARQYDQCKDLNGQSAWNKDGVWKCLFKNETSTQPDDWFTDYSKFLDWRRYMRQNIARQREKERQEWQNIWKPAASTPEKYISESEAEKAGKRVTSSSVTSETITNESGNLETKKVVKKWYDDGTVSLSESTSTGSGNGMRKGWFWGGESNSNSSSNSNQNK